MVLNCKCGEDIGGITEEQQWDKVVSCWHTFAKISPNAIHQLSGPDKIDANGLQAEWQGSN